MVFYNLQSTVRKFRIHSIICGYLDFFQKKHPYMASILNTDKLDLSIIEQLMHDANISYAEIGKKLFVSAGTIHVRIKKLQEAGIISGMQYNVDLKKLGYDVIAFIGIYLEK